MIKLKNVSKIFDVSGKKLTALDNVSLDIPKGHICGVIGASGAGKSTLIRCVNLLEKPTVGSVIIDGKDLTQLSDAELVLERRNIGMIFQHFNLLSSRTVFGNVALPLELEGTPKEKIEAKVNELLYLVGLSDKKNVYPSNLSGGQKQRVAIARALASNPKVLLCDEATSALDPELEAEVLKVVIALAREKKSLVIVTHNMNFARKVADRILFLDKGKIAFDGDAERFFASRNERIMSFISAMDIRFLKF